MVRAVRLTASTEALLDPDARTWSALGPQSIQLSSSPLVLQPSEYIQNKWNSLTHGQTPEVRVRAAHNGEAIFFRLEWDDAVDDSHPNNMANFPDQAGVMLPLKDDAPIAEMGLEKQPVNMWLWRADVDAPFYVTAKGRGTTTRHADTPLKGKGAWRNGTWAAVIARPFNVNLPAEFVVPLAPGMTHKCTFAVWQGSNKERGGLKAYHPLWESLEIDA
jgi:DMSO reductase family type II enzyme heme b subunit